MAAQVNRARPQKLPSGPKGGAPKGLTKLNKAPGLGGTTGAVNGVASQAVPSAYEIMAGRIANRVAEMAENITFVERCVPLLSPYSIFSPVSPSHPSPLYVLTNSRPLERDNLMLLPLSKRLIQQRVKSDLASWTSALAHPLKATCPSRRPSWTTF